MVETSRSSLLGLIFLPDVRRSSATKHGRERPPADVRGVWPCAPDQRAAGQDHRREQRLVRHLDPAAHGKRTVDCVTTDRFRLDNFWLHSFKLKMHAFAQTV